MSAGLRVVTSAEGQNFGVRTRIEWDGQTVWEDRLRPAGMPSTEAAEAQIASIRRGRDLAGRLDHARRTGCGWPTIGDDERADIDAYTAARARLAEVAS